MRLELLYWQYSSWMTLWWTNCSWICRFAPFSHTLGAIWRTWSSKLTRHITRRPSAWPSHRQALLRSRDHRIRCLEGSQCCLWAALASIRVEMLMEPTKVATRSRLSPLRATTLSSLRIRGLITPQASTCQIRTWQTSKQPQPRPSNAQARQLQKVALISIS